MGQDAFRVAVMAGLLAGSGCQSSLQPAPHKLHPWTAELRDAQPADSYAAVYRTRNFNLIFLAAKHSTNTDSLTFRLIREAYGAFTIDMVIVEGFPNSDEPSKLIEWATAKSTINGFQEGGEVAPAIRGALEEGASVKGGEPGDEEIRNRVLAQGFSQQDLLGFYTLRSVPQWMREQKIRTADEPRIRSLIVAELEKNRSRLGFRASVLPGYDDWENWYTSTNGKAFGVEFELEETGPLAGGPYGSNQIAAAISRVRAVFLHRLIIEHVNANQSTMAVFGASHLSIHRPALDYAIGPPCYVGISLEEARTACTGQSAVAVQ